MRKIIASMMVSVDGFVEGMNPEEYWHNWNEEMAAYMMSFFKTVDTFIYGRKAYQEMISYWPQLNDEFARIMNETPKLVYSRTLKSVTWNSRLFSEVDPGYIHDLKIQPGKDIVIFAGPDIVESFMKHDLIDEFRLIVNPLLLGAGKPYFKGIAQTTPLSLAAVEKFDCGNMILVYTPVKEQKRQRS